MKRSDIRPSLLAHFEAYCFDTSQDSSSEPLFQAWLAGHLLGYATALAEAELAASPARAIDERGD